MIVNRKMVHWVHQGLNSIEFDFLPSALRKAPAY